MITYEDWDEIKMSQYGREDMQSRTVDKVTLCDLRPLAVTGCTDFAEVGKPLLYA